MEEINRFAVLAKGGPFTITDLCEQFGISRKTGYKHLERYAAEGVRGLQPRSHRPHQFPQITDEAVEALILTERRLHRTCAGRKRQVLTLDRLRPVPTAVPSHVIHHQDSSSGSDRFDHRFWRGASPHTT
jgi:transposase